MSGRSSTPTKRERARRLRQQSTPADSLLWQELRTNELAGLHFRRQHLIEGFIVDFYCFAAGLVVELDGPRHSQRAEYNRERDEVLVGHGLRVLRVSNEDVLQRLPWCLSA